MCTYKTKKRRHSTRNQIVLYANIQRYTEHFFIDEKKKEEKSGSKTFTLMYNFEKNKTTKQQKLKN